MDLFVKCHLKVHIDIDIDIDSSIQKQSCATAKNSRDSLCHTGDIACAIRLARANLAIKSQDL